MIDKGSEMIATVGQAVQSKVDQTGLSTGVSYYVNKTAEGTVNLGHSIIDTGTAAVSTA